jgi:hypothetical protein
MANNRDAILLETVKTHRSRLTAAFLFGELPERRIANDNVRRFIGGIVLGAVACAICVGIAFVTNLLAEQAAEREAANTNSSLVVGTDATPPGTAPSTTALPAAASPTARTLPTTPGKS